MREQKKLYFAILNRGWIRREVAFSVLPKLNNTRGVSVYLERPSLTWAHPISANRNLIVKRFLESNCDFLLMMDDDIVPFHNPAELVWANKDIIGSPAKVRGKGRMICWVAYVKVPGTSGEEGYVPVDFSMVDSDIELLRVDVVGTGCILIRRNVLEAIKAPFRCEWHEDGYTTFGTDFAFCRRAKKHGFEIYTTPWRRCEHIKSNVGLSDIEGYDSSDFHDLSSAKYSIPWGDKAITMKDWAFIKNIIRKKKIKTVVEFGCGLSSLLMSEMCSVFSLDDKPDVLNKVRGRIREQNSLKLSLWDGVCVDSRKVPSDIDLVFVDGPLGTANNGPGRKVSIKLASELADKVIVHDAGRADEERWQSAFLRPSFKLVSWSGSHIARCNYWERKKSSG